MFNEHCSWKKWRLDNQKFYFHGSWIGCPILTTLTAILQKKQNAGGKKTRLWRVLGRECTNAWWSINTPFPRGGHFSTHFSKVFAIIVPGQSPEWQFLALLWLRTGLRGDQQKILTQGKTVPQEIDTFCLVGDGCWCWWTSVLRHCGV